MKRSPLKRKAPLKRGGYIRRKNTPEAKAKREAKHERDFGELAEYVRTLPCWVCGLSDESQQTPTQACHVRSRGAGGHAWREDGSGNLAPQCDHHHRLQHSAGWGALAKGGKDAAALIARAVGERFRTIVD